MGGGLMQLVAYGAQDIYLTGNPQITFFKVVYRRHTNFSMESIEQTFNGSADFGKKVTCTISRNGDLISRVYLQVTLPRIECSDEGDRFRWLNWIGHTLIKNVEVEIGGQRIDKHYGDWLHVWNELTQTAGHQVGYANMVGNLPRLTQVVSGQGGATTSPPQSTYDNCDNSGCIPETTLYIPLQFWFCRNPGLALPLIALQYHEVKVNITFATKDALGGGDAAAGAAVNSASLWVDYIYLDTDERRRFAQVSHEYLIEQLQFTGKEDASTTSHRLNFNHPVKELVWVHNDSESPDEWNAHKAIIKAKLQLNGHDRMAERVGKYFSHVQPYQHHTNVPMAEETVDGEAGAAAVTKFINGNINVYSFALKPEDHQPSGTCNMSRIDNATLSVTANTTAGGDSGHLYIFAVNYNVLRIMGGMGGLAYSN